MAEKGLGTPATRATDHRRPDLREVHAPRGPRAGAHGQGLPADDAAARPGRRGPDQARAHRQLGVPARRDGARPPEARGLHDRDRADGRAHRAQGQGVRPRHHPRRLRDAGHAVPQLRRRGQGELPPLRLHRRGRRGRGRRLRLLDHQDPGRPQLRAGRGRSLPARQEDRPARGLPLQGRLALHRRAEAGLRRRDRQLEARVRLRRGRQARRRIGEPVDFSEPAKPGRLPQVPGPCLRARHQLRLRARGRRARHLRLQERQDHPAAAGGARADEQAAGTAARPSCWRTSSPTRRGASSRPTWPTTRRKAR